MTKRGAQRARGRRKAARRQAATLAGASMRAWLNDTAVRTMGGDLLAGMPSLFDALRKGGA